MMKTIPNKNITLDQLNTMFELAQKTNMDLSTHNLWGYFFTHHEPKLLKKAKKILKAKGFQYVKIYQSGGFWWLHVEKIEIHTPESLDKRNDELYILADKLKLDSYDGMDVGPVM